MGTPVARNHMRDMMIREHMRQMEIARIEQRNAMARAKRDAAYVSAVISMQSSLPVAYGVTVTRPTSNVVIRDCYVHNPVARRPRFLPASTGTRCIPSAGHNIARARAMWRHR